MRAERVGSNHEEGAMMQGDYDIRSERGSSKQLCSLQSGFCHEGSCVRQKACWPGVRQGYKKRHDGAVWGPGKGDGTVWDPLKLSIDQWEMPGMLNCGWEC